MFKKIPILVLLLVGLSSALALAKEKVIFFYSTSCQECLKVKNDFLPGLYAKFQDKIELEYRDIADIENYKSLLALKKEYGLTQEVKVPIVFCAGNFLSGSEKITRQLEGLFISVGAGRASPKREKKAAFDLFEHFASFTPWAVTSAGLIDGINPCAFTVIVFFISFLGLQGYRKRELVLIGLFFILAVFLTYLFIGLGLFGFFYTLKGFWLVRKIINYAIGFFSLFLGILAVFDCLKYVKTGSSEESALQLPTAIKKRIQAVIAGHYRKPKDKTAASAGAKALFSLVLTALITGFLVSILEAVCTGQTYLPTISFILKSAPLKFSALGYLLLYNLMFIVPLLIIFLFALLGVSSAQFAQFFKKHFLTSKVLLALLFLGLGIFLIWRS